jgi:hypothetical protein
MSIWIWTGMGTILANAAVAASISIPNYSFELPTTPFVATVVDSWQQAPSPDFQLTGVFLNVGAPPEPPIDNCDGLQAAYLFANPGVALFQDYDSTDYTNQSPTHAFDAVFEVGKAYTLTVAVIGGGGAMTNGVTLDLSLYYRDAESNMVTVGDTVIAYTPDLFPSHYHFVDFQAHVPTVQAGDPWAGQHIGIQLLSTVDPSLASGYWDLDNVRLVSTVTPLLTDPTYTNGHFSFALQSEPGLAFEVLASENIEQGLSNWTSLGRLTNVTGTVPFTDPTTGLNRRFYRARQLP